MPPLDESMHEPATWDLVAPGYAVAIAPLFAAFAEDALKLAALAPGERVLDVAAGPGTLSLAAARAGARVCAIDFSPRMLAELGARAEREGVSGIDARIGDATALPYRDGEFDAVFSMFALNLVADRAAAFRELFRVTRAGGRAVVGTPGAMMRSPAFVEVLDILRRALPDFAFDERDLPLSDPAELLDETAAGGFAEVGVREVVHAFELPSVAAMWSVAERAVAPIVLAREAIGDARWRTVSTTIVSELERAFGTSPKSFDVRVNLALARK